MTVGDPVRLRSLPAGAPSGSHLVGLPVRGLLVVLLTGAVLLAGLASTPWGRRQLELSFTHVPERYVELSFTDPAGQRRCAPAPTVTVDFSVVSHLGREGRLPYAVTVTSGGAAREVARGVVTVADGAGAHVTQTFDRPDAAPWTARVVLDMTGAGLTPPEPISVTCGRTP